MKGEDGGQGPCRREWSLSGKNGRAGWAPLPTSLPVGHMGDHWLCLLWGWDSSSGGREAVL